MMIKELVLEILAPVLLLAGCAKPAAELTPTAATPRPQPELPFAQELQDVLDGWLEGHSGVGISAAIAVPGYKTWVGVSGVSHGATPITAEIMCPPSRFLGWAKGLLIAP